METSSFLRGQFSYAWVSLIQVGLYTEQVAIPFFLLVQNKIFFPHCYLTLGRNTYVLPREKLDLCLWVPFPDSQALAGDPESSQLTRLQHSDEQG